MKLKMKSIKPTEHKAKMSTKFYIKRQIIQKDG